MAYPVGVIQRTFDESLYETAPSGTILGVVGVAHRGPINVRTEITSPSEYVATFGLPTTQLGCAVMQFLRCSSNLIVVRVEDGSAAFATVDIVNNLTSILTVTAKTKGTWGNDLSAETVAAEDGVADHVNIKVYYQNVLMREHANVDGFTAAAALGDDLVDFAQASGSPAWPAAWTGEYRTYTLASGASGTSAVDTDFIGTAAVEPTTPATGLHLFDNPEDCDIDLVACPGESDKDVVAALLLLAGVTRQDCIALIDPPDNLTRDEVKQWVNGTYAGGPPAALNDRFGITSYPWHFYIDEYSPDGIWVAPSGPLAAVIANSEKESNPFMAPAGRKRGLHKFTSELRWNPSKPDQVSMYSIAGQNINPWVKLRDAGIVLRGQKTLQRTATALDRLSAQRTLLYAQKKLDRLAQNFEFDKSNAKTWGNLIDACKLVLDPIRGDGGIYDYRVQCDDKLNTAAVRDRNEIMSKVFVQFEKDGEWIFIDWVVRSYSAGLE